jgi:hypothetical protein
MLEGVTCPLELGADCLHLPPVGFRRLLTRQRPRLRFARRPRPAAIEQGAQRESARNQRERAEHGRNGYAGSLPGRSHQTSCSVTASPRRLIASRVGRSSASSM